MTIDDLGRYRIERAIDDAKSAASDLDIPGAEHFIAKGMSLDAIKAHLFDLVVVRKVDAVVSGDCVTVAATIEGGTATGDAAC